MSRGGELVVVRLVKDVVFKEPEAVTPDEARDALKKTLACDGFVASPRLQQFLTYIVEETLAGRGAQILGKEIAVKVYERQLDDGDGGQNLVRVEARRLRRLLDEYYDHTGAGDAVRIHIDPGGYKPRILLVPAATSPETLPLDDIDVSSTIPKHDLPVRYLIAGITTCAILAAVAVFIFQTRLPDAGADALATAQAERLALRQHSIPRLQAANLAEQARGMLFPIFDVQRQILSLDIFRHAIELDPQFSDGYTGASQVLSVLAVLTQESEQAESLRSQSTEMADKALDLAPTDAWANASKGLSLAVSGDFENALKRARNAVNLAPNDGHVLDLVGLTGILARDPELAAEVSQPDRTRNGGGRFGARSIWGVSQIMLGNYEEAVDAFNGAAAVGAPVSAPTLIFQAVAHEQLSETNEAQKLVAELGQTWPEFPAKFIVHRIFGEEAMISANILAALQKYGFPPSSQ